MTKPRLIFFDCELLLPSSTSIRRRCVLPSNPQSRDYIFNLLLLSRTFAIKRPVHWSGVTGPRRPVARDLGPRIDEGHKLYHRRKVLAKTVQQYDPWSKESFVSWGTFDDPWYWSWELEFALNEVQESPNRIYSSFAIVASFRSSNTITTYMFYNLLPRHVLTSTCRVGI